MNLLKYGDTIGIISPSWVADRNDYEKYAQGIESLGFQVRFGREFSIPVAYCDDFGHGSNHAIFPIGRRAVLDTENKTLLFQ